MTMFVANAQKVESDSLKSVLSLAIDTVPAQPSAEASAQLSQLDTLKKAFDNEHNIVLDEYGKPKYSQWNDSIAAVEDSIRKNKKESPLENPVTYEAKDSVVFYMGAKNAYLFGSSKVSYQDMNLESEKISMNLDSSIVHATYMTDSVGAKYGSPVFSQGSDKYESEQMDYNFKTKRGFIQNVYTVQDEGFLRSEEAKRDENGTLYLAHGRYTTCDEEHPHFYIALSRAKAHPGKDVFSGPAWLVVEDVPLPLAIPFAYFPFTSKYSSGIIMPSYGDEFTRGFYLHNGGYYFAISDRMDLKLLGEIYTKGSWGLSAQTNYNRRYKYSGSLYFDYQVTKTSEHNLPDFSEEKSFKFQWSHRQDPKASLNSSFSASVNFASQQYEHNNLTSLYNPASYSQSTRTSSVSYSRSFPKSGISISSSMNISQNMRDSTISLSLPNLSVSVSRFYPLKRKHKVGKDRWYEKIAMNYTGTLSNSISTKEDLLLKSNIIKDWRNGVRHNIPISASFTLFGNLNITPSFNYTERWYSNRIEQSWDMATQSLVRDTIYGFNRVYDYNLSLAANTKMYVTFQPNPKVFGDKIKMVRHVITPTVSFSYAPDFSDSRYGFYKTYTKTDLDGNVSLVEYSPYSNGIYGTVSKGKLGSVSFDLGNNIEMKVKSDLDSIGEKVISIIDELGASLSYNMAAPTKPWSNLSTRLRLKWGKFTFNMNAVFDTYAYAFDKNGNVIVGDRTEWSYGRFGRFQGMSKNLSYTFNNQTLRTWKKKLRKLRGLEGDDETENKEETDNPEDNPLETNMDKSASAKAKGKAENTLDEDGYMKFSMPWSFTISYGLTMAEDRTSEINVRTMRYPYKLTQNMNFSGSLKLSSNWDVSFSSGWDFNDNKLSMTSVNIHRDLHCFNISAGFVFGMYTSYNVTLRATASTLTDALKYDKRSSYSSNIRWY